MQHMSSHMTMYQNVIGIKSYNYLNCQGLSQICATAKSSCGIFFFLFSQATRRDNPL